MSEPIVCVGEGSRPTGIRYAVGGPRAISPGEYPSLSLTNTPPEKYFPQMAARGVHLTWEKEGFVLYWRPNAAFPYVDIYAWCDVEYIQIHLSAQGPMKVVFSIRTDRKPPVVHRKVFL